MHEILFRGKRVNGTWKYGSYVEQYGSTQIYLKDGVDEDGFDRYHIDPDTVGRFTGLTDRSGVKIFEGDIVRYGDTIHRVVFEQRNGTAYFGLVYSACETLPFGHYQDLKQIEVIGNIYDNPELLEVSGDE